MTYFRQKWGKTVVLVPPPATATCWKCHQFTSNFQKVGLGGFELQILDSPSNQEVLCVMKFLAEIPHIPVITEGTFFDTKYFPFLSILVIY